ncbi:UDP-N-acetylglucosamine 2-epimerase [Chloroflexota bacterium]
MRIIICKFYNVKDIEGKVGKLVAKETRRAGDKVKVVCVEELTQKRLESVGITNEIFRDFAIPDAEDELSWEKAYHLSDELHSSAENDDKLKYSRINFLTMEYHIIKYVYAVKLSNLLRSMVKQNWEVIILVLTSPYNDWLADINSSRIKTVRHGKRTQATMKLIKLLWRRVHQGYLLFPLVKNYFQKPAAKKRSAPTQEKDQKRTRALFIISTHLYTRPALTIGEECLRNGLIPSIATDDMSLLPLLQSYNIGYSIKSPLFISLASYITKYFPLLHRLKKHINSFYENRVSPYSRSDEFSEVYLCQKTLLAELPGLCHQAISGVIFLERFINNISPDIVCVMPHDHFLQQIASTLAKKRYNIPTLACSAAWETNTTSSFRNHLHADKLATSGEKMRHMYLESGLEPERVVATGIAHFDGLFNRDKGKDRQILLNHGIDPDKQFIIFATDVLPMNEAESMLAGVIDAIQKIKDIHLVVKVHPREEVGPFQTIVERYHIPSLQVVKDIDLYALLCNCQLVITKGSTVALEAMMIGKPVIILDLGGVSVAVPYLNEGAAIGIYREQDIEEAILKILYDEESRRRLKADRDKFVRNWAHEPDGRASERIVMLMKEMIRTSRG